MPLLRTGLVVRRRAAAAAALCVVVGAVSCVAGRAKSAGNASPGEVPMRVDETANGNEIRMKVGETLEVVLAETRTAGYRWNVASDGAPVCRLERDRLEAPSATPGAPARHTWTFTAAQAGAAAIELAYARSFGSAEAARRFTLRVVAQ